MREWLATRLREPRMSAILSIGMIAVSAALAANYSRSLLAFLLFQASILVLYFARMTRWLKMLLAGLALGILMPTLGTINGYYLEVATQVGIFVALALGLNIVVGLAGLLDLGYVAFYAVGAYTWAIFGSPQAGQFIPESVARFPLGGQWFFLFLLLGVMVAGTTGVILGLPKRQTSRYWHSLYFWR